MRLARYLLLSIALFITALPGVAGAQSDADKTTARALAIEGQKALDAGDHETAADRFARADKLYHAPTLLVGLARAYVGLGKLVEAMETYNKVIREKLPDDASEAFKEAVAEARTEVEGLDQKIGWVTIRVEGPDEPSVTMDGKEISAASLGVKRAVNPGEHLVKAGGEGYASSERSFTASAGSHEEVVLTLQPGVSDIDDPEEGGDSGETLRLVFIGIGVGAAGLLVGAITGGLAIGKHGELEDNCQNNSCPPDQEDNLDSYRTLGTVSTVGFIVGGVLAATGIVLVIVGSTGDSGAEPAEEATLTTQIGPGSIGATLRF
jgi:hypothetical protein